MDAQLQNMLQQFKPLYASVGEDQRRKVRQLVKRLASTMNAIDAGHRHKSATNEEHYYHTTTTRRGVGVRCTIFVRNTVPLGADAPPQWFRSIAYCAPGDTFSRAAGRSAARRKWFAGKREPVRWEDWRTL